MHLPSHRVAATIRAELYARADPVRGAGMARYLKSTRPCLGVRVPAVRRLAMAAARRATLADWTEAEGVVRDLYGGAWREEQYAAIGLARAWLPLAPPAALDVYAWMIRQGAWWDLVDEIATHLVGPLMRRHPGLRHAVFGYAEAEDLWLRRTAIICQLHFGTETDTDALTRVILRCAAEREFFIRKAIGWALREFAKTDAAFVRKFVARHGARLSPLSCREALRHLD